MKHTKWMVCAFLSLILITPSILIAADEAVIQDLATDVNVAKSKADKNALEINSLKGGLPALEERVAELEDALATALPEISQLKADLAKAIADILLLQTALANEQEARIAAINDLQGKIDGLDADLTAEEGARIAADNILQDNIDALVSSALEARVAAIEDKTECVSENSNATDFILEGCNVHVRNGLNTTFTTNGFGNLIIGYNEEFRPRTRTGSHNLVVGFDHAYTSSSGLVAGLSNSIYGIAATVSGGRVNTASGNYSFIGGGFDNEAFADYSAILGGNSNVTGDNSDIDHTVGEWSTISGGENNIASGDYSSISGGSNVTVSGPSDWAAAGIEATSAGLDIESTAALNITSGANLNLQGANMYLNGPGHPAARVEDNTITTVTIGPEGTTSQWPGRITSGSTTVFIGP